jgi:hypothetical protein
LVDAIQRVLAPAFHGRCVQPEAARELVDRGPAGQELQDGLAPLLVAAVVSLSLCEFEFLG